MLILPKHYKEYKKCQVVFSIIPWVQGFSIMLLWGPFTNLHRLWIEMSIAAIGGGCIITTLLSESMTLLTAPCPKLMPSL